MSNDQQQTATPGWWQCRRCVPHRLYRDRRTWAIHVTQHDLGMLEEGFNGF